MGKSTLKCMPKFGTFINIGSSLPYTAPNDGILFLYLSADGSQNSYVQLSGEQVYRVSAHYGYSTSASFPIRRGETLTYSGGAGGTPSIWFRPII